VAFSIARGSDRQHPLGAARGGANRAVATTSPTTGTMSDEIVHSIACCARSNKSSSGSDAQRQAFELIKTTACRSEKRRKRRHHGGGDQVANHRAYVALRGAISDDEGDNVRTTSQRSGRRRSTEMASQATTEPWLERLARGTR